MHVRPGDSCNYLQLASLHTTQVGTKAVESLQYKQATVPPLVLIAA